MKEQLKTLSPILINCLVRVDENGRVLSKPHDVHITSLQGSQDHGKLWHAYENALEVVQMPRVMEFVDVTRNPALIDLVDTKYGSDTPLTIWDWIGEYTDFAKHKPELYMYIPVDGEGKPMEKPKKPKQTTDTEDPLGVTMSYRNQKYGKAMEAYQLALEKVLFYGWEVIHQGANRIIIGSGDEPWILRFYKGKLFLGTTELTDLDKAFAETPHFVQLDKIK